MSFGTQKTAAAGGDGSLDSLLATRLDEDEQFLSTLNYLNDGLCLQDASGGTTEQRLRMALEDRELELNQQYLEMFEKVNDQVQGFVHKIRSMNDICRELTGRIQANKEKTRELLKKTNVLQVEKKQLGVRKQYLDDFFAKFALAEQEERALANMATDHSTFSDDFFKAFKHMLEVEKSVREQLALEPDNMALLEISHLLAEKQKGAYIALYTSVQRECRLLNVEFLDLKPALVHSFELLHKTSSADELFVKALEDYGNARRGFVVRAFIDTLTKGAKTAGVQTPIEQLSTDPLRYVNEMLAWIQHTVAVEKELLAALLRECTRHGAERVPALARAVLSSISEALCQPLRLRVEQCITKEANCVVLYRLSTLLLYYAENYQEVLSPEAHLVLCCRDLQELCSNMFFSAVSSAIQRILGNSRVPDYDLLPVPSVSQALLLLRDILESQNDGAFSAVQDKRGLYNKIFMHILDPLLQSVQLVCSNLDDPLDVACYMLNCLSAIRSVIILYQYTDAKLEMLKAQIEANEDVLVSEQASRVLMDADMMELYTKAQAHQPNQGPLSKIAGMEGSRVRASLVQFNQFLDCPDSNNCSQTVKISTARIRDSVQRRTYEHIIAAYRVIWQKLVEPENGYQTLEQLKSVEDVEKLLLKTNQQ